MFLLDGVVALNTVVYQLFLVVLHDICFGASQAPDHPHQCPIGNVRVGNSEIARRYGISSAKAAVHLEANVDILQCEIETGSIHLPHCVLLHIHHTLYFIVDDDNDGDDSDYDYYSCWEYPVQIPQFWFYIYTRHLLG